MDYGEGTDSELIGLLNKHKEAGEYTEALEYAERLLMRDKRSADYWFIKGELLYELANMNSGGEHVLEALRCLERSYALDKTKQDVLIVKGFCLMLDGKFQDSVPVFEEADSLDQKNPEPSFALSMAYVFLNDETSATFHLNRAVKKDGERTLFFCQRFFDEVIASNSRISQSLKMEIAEAMGEMRRTVRPAALQGKSPGFSDFLLSEGKN